MQAYCMISLLIQFDLVFCVPYDNYNNSAETKKTRNIIIPTDY